MYINNIANGMVLEIQQDKIEIAMDRQLSNRQLLRRKLKMILPVIVIVLIILISFTGLRKILNPAVDIHQLMIAVAEQGRIEDTITAIGKVIPEFEQVITSPILSIVEEVYHQAGEEILAGLPVMRLNTEIVHLDLDRLTEELKLHKNKKVQLNLALERNRTELQARLDIKNLNLELLQSKLKQTEHLFDIGAGSKDHLDQARLNLEIANRELVLLEQTIANEERTLGADLREIDLTIAIQEKSIAEVEHRLDRAEIRAERNGVITWVNDNIGSTIQPGEAVVRIADLSSFKIEGQISDIHAAHLKLGIPVNVRINERALTGKISGIQPTIRNGIITFFVELENKTDQALRSNLRVDVYVITAYKENIIRVEYGPFVRGPGKQQLFVIDKDKAYRRSVRIGATNLDFIEIEEGVKAGERIIISDMEKYRHRDVLKIRNN